MKKNGKKNLSFFIILIFFSISKGSINEKNQTSEPGLEKTTLAEIDELMKEKTIENCEKAIKEYELLLKNDPNNYEILHKIANAYITIIDIKTSALIVEKDEYKPILKKMGKIANDYAKKAYELNPNSKEVIAACLGSYGYYSASFGLVKAFFKGAVGHYKNLCNQIIEIDDTYHGALGYRALGKLYHIAPWPVGSKKKALKFFKKAQKIDNTLLHSHYYLGLIYFDNKQYNLAEKEFTFVWENEPNELEKHIIDAYKKMARYYLRQIAKVKRKT